MSQVLVVDDDPALHDAIAVALRVGTPIYVADSVLDEVGITIPDEDENEVEKFREFLDQITPEDFASDQQ